MVLSLQLLILALAFPVVLEGTAVELRETTPALVQWALRDQLVKKVIAFTSVERKKYQIRAVIDGLCPLKQSATFFKTGNKFSSSYLKLSQCLFQIIFCASIEQMHLQNCKYLE